MLLNLVIYSHHICIVADHVKLSYGRNLRRPRQKICGNAAVRSGLRHQGRWEGRKVYPKRHSRQTVRFHATQLDFMPEGPRRIIPDATKLDPWAGLFEAGLR